MLPLVLSRCTYEPISTRRRFDKRASDIGPTLVGHTEVIEKGVIWSTLSEHASNDDSILDCHRNVAVWIVFDAPTEEHRVHLIDPLSGVPIPRFPNGELSSPGSG
jgi:hypothetical protein